MTLTEQWKKGELPSGEYYIKLKDKRIFIAYYNGKEFRSLYNSDIAEIIAEVPTYDEWKQLKKYERIVKSYYGKPIDYDIACETVNKLLDEKNFLKEEISGYKRLTAQLKELLKSALSWLPDGSKLRGMRYAQLQSIKRKINQVLGEE